MKIAVVIARVLMGLLYLFSVIAYFFQFLPQQEMTAPAQHFVFGLSAAGYFMPVLKSIELICALALLSGKFVALAAVVIFPITVNIVLFHAFLAPDGMIIPALLLISNLFLAYFYRERYKLIVAQ